MDIKAKDVLVMVHIWLVGWWLSLDMSPKHFAVIFFGLFVAWLILRLAEWLEKKGY